VLRGAAEGFANPTDQKGLTTPSVRSDLRSNGSSCEGEPTEFADCDLDALRNMIVYSFKNGVFHAHASVGLELVAATIFKLCQALGCQTRADDAVSIHSNLNVVD
jgi:hypothetical protein